MRMIKFKLYFRKIHLFSEVGLRRPMTTENFNCVTDSGDKEKKETCT